MVPLLAKCVGTAAPSLSSAAKLNYEFNVNFGRRFGVPGIVSRCHLVPKTLVFPLSSAFRPENRLLLSAASCSVSDGDYESSLFLFSLDGNTGSDVDSEVLGPARVPSSSRGSAIDNFRQLTVLEEEWEDDQQAEAEPTSTSLVKSASDSGPFAEQIREDAELGSNSGQPNPYTANERKSSIADKQTFLRARSRYLSGGNSYESWMVRREESEEEKPDSEGIYNGRPFDEISTHISDMEEEQQTWDGVVVENGNRPESENSALKGKEELPEEVGKDLLIEFLDGRRENWVTKKPEKRAANHSVFTKGSTTRRPSPTKQKTDPISPLQANKIDMTNFSVEATSTERLSAGEEAMGKENVLSESLCVDGGSGGGRLVKSVLKLSRSLPQNSSLEEFLKPLLGRVSTKDGNLVLKALGTEEMTWPMLSFFQWMRLQDPCLLDSRSFCIIFTYLGKLDMVDQAIALYKNLPSDTRFHAVQVYNALLAALSRCDRGDSIAVVLQDMKDRKVERDSVTYSILITATQKEKDRLQKVWSMFDDMLLNGLSPDLAVFGALIRAFCDGGHHKQASLISLSMEKMGLMPNVIIYNTLIDAYGKSGQLEEAEGILLEMRNRGLQPTAFTYNSLVNGYGKSGQCEVAEELVLDMQRQGLEPDVITYTSLIRAYGKQKLTEKAVNAFLRMRKIGIVPTSRTYTALINAYAEGGWHDRAEMTVASMQREGLRPSVETYTALLDGYRRAGKVDMVLQVWKRMKEEGCELTRVTYNTLMDAFAKQGRFNEARDVMAEIRANGMEPDLMAYNMLLNAYGRGGLQSKLPKILREMRVAGYEPDSFTYCTLIYASLRFRDFTSAFKWEREMSEKGQRPDSKTYSKMKHLLSAKYTEKQDSDRKAALGQLQALRRKARKNPQRLKTFKKEITKLREGPLAGYRRPKKTGATGKQSEKDKAFWKKEDDDQRNPFRA